MKINNSSFARFTLFRKILVIATFCSLILVFVWAVFIHNYPLKSSEDVWHYLASTHELTNDYSNINDPFFSSGPKDLHYGPYLVTAGILAKAMSIDVITLYSMLSVINPLFVMAALYVFYRSFDPKSSRINAYFFTLFAVMCWGANTLAYSGFFSLADLLLNGAAPANFGFATAVLAISLLLRKQIDFPQRYTLFFILAFLTFISHPLTGVMLFLVLFAYLISEIIKYRKLSLEVLLFGFVPLFIFILAMSWPYYSIFDFFFNKTRLVNGVESVKPLVVTQWLPIGGIGFIGLLFLLKRKNVFLLIWATLFLVVLLSYLTPFQISLYWRFLPLLILPGLAALYYELSLPKNKNKLGIVLLTLIVLVGLVSTYSKYNYRASWPSYNTDKWAVLKNHSREDVLLSDPFTGYIAAGLYGINIVAAREGHRNPINEDASISRENDLAKIFEKSLDEETILNILRKYKVTYVLVNYDVDYRYNWYENDQRIAKLSVESFEESNYVVYKIRIAD